MLNHNITNRFSSKSSWKNSSPLITCCYNSIYSIGLDVETCFVYSTTIDYTFEFEITLICGDGVIIEVIVFLKKLRDAFNSSLNSLLLCSCSKIIISSDVGARKANGYT